MERKYFFIKENDEIKGYAVPVGGPGLWGGSIEGYIGLSADLSHILG